MAEIELNMMTRQCLNRRIQDISILRKELSAWETDKNEESKKIVWQFTSHLFNIHAQRHGLITGSSRYTQLMKDFVALLENGEYRINHDADYFAEKLFVSAKHLSFVSRKTTGFSATYWINRFLQMDIRKKLYKHDATISELSKYYNFSSTSYFTRYVESNLGGHLRNCRNKNLSLHETARCAHFKICWAVFTSYLSFFIVTLH